MGDEEAMEELEQVTGHPQGPQAIDEPPLVDSRIEELRKRCRGAPDARRLHPLGGNVVERFAGPLQARHEILLVEPGALVELFVLPLDEAVELLGKEKLEAEPGGFQKLVVEHRPDEEPHPLGLAVDGVRLVDAVDDHHHPGVAEGGKHPLKLREELVTVVAARMLRQRLASEIDLRHPRQGLGQLAGGTVAGAHAANDPPRGPPRPHPPP